MTLDLLSLGCFKEQVKAAIFFPGNVYTPKLHTLSGASWLPLSPSSSMKPQQRTLALA